MEMLENAAKYILRAASELGADSAQCSVAESETREFNVDGGEFSLMRTLFDRSVAITVLVGGRPGAVSVNRLGEDDLRAAVEEAVAAAESAVPDPAREFAPGPTEKDFTSGSPEADTEGLFQRIREFTEAIALRHPKLLVEQLIADHTRTKKVYMNSRGVIYRTLSGKYNLGLNYSAHDGEETTSTYGGGFVLDDLRTPFIDLPLMDKEMADVERQLGAKPIEDKFTGTALFAPACLAGDILEPILSNFASDAGLLDGTSLWKEKLGQAVADPRIDIALRPSDPRIAAGQSYTDEGDLAEDFHVVRDGVLDAFRLSRYAANKLSLKRGGNTSSSMIVRPGDTSLADIIAGIDRGVLLMRFSGGYPGASGEFSGVAKNGFLIENGRLGAPLTETMISGNLAEMLQNLQAVSRETLEDGYVSVPYMAFGGITVSGK